MKVLKTFWQQRQNSVYSMVAMQGLDLLGPDRTAASQQGGPLQSIVLIVR
jgi:hypothetical protein